MFGCSRAGLIERRIGNRVNNCKPNNACIIKITEITNFQWDKMYVFEMSPSAERMTEIMDTPPPYFSEFTKHLVFLKDDKIVHYEQNPTGISEVLDGEVGFGDSNKGYKLFTPETAIFKAEKKSFKSGIYYSLKQKNDPF